MKKNCQNCKHGITAWSDNNPGLEKLGFSKVSYNSAFSGELMVKCNNSHNEENLKWWNENGQKIEDITEMDCHEPTLFHVKTDSIMGKLDKMIDILDKYNDNVK